MLRVVDRGQYREYQKNEKQSSVPSLPACRAHSPPRSLFEAASRPRPRQRQAPTLEYDILSKKFTMLSSCIIC